MNYRQVVASLPHHKINMRPRRNGTVQPVRFPSIGNPETAPAANRAQFQGMSTGRYASQINRIGSPERGNMAGNYFSIETQRKTFGRFTDTNPAHGYSPRLDFLTAVRQPYRHDACARMFLVIQMNTGPRQIEIVEPPAAAAAVGAIGERSRLDVII